MNNDSPTTNQSDDLPSDLFPAKRDDQAAPIQVRDEAWTSGPRTPSDRVYLEAAADRAAADHRYFIALSLLDLSHKV
jgi:hypothetical protein